MFGAGWGSILIFGDAVVREGNVIAREKKRRSEERHIVNVVLLVIGICSDR